ncbi:uncharacterized protein BHQ10_009607 [Talaromyces amestolkiae]|uniref:D-xylose 1-dehydrogenase (NADP(+), D-xylono-1,5-lactone-forming) n=1 Tax=Talaromyces amestolkiae TaxID=1196081 RepID=A0A364LCN9_TALAM|nr:uncharacterized protein BHQ10_009607 [Talaromyces amestolkiae]RAO73595.1 hypothetical protein BHQ10_009607 [Talaromyces amestolkiae]
MSFLRFFQRGYTALLNPPEVSKHEDAIRLGLLGASTIAPLSVINPAKSHPEVIVAAVAARYVKRAEQYAKKYDIPTVHASYQELLDDPYIDAVYIALPNHLHFEWALRSLQAGKHVLLEKPSCSNSEEARLLFNHSLATKKGAPVLLEAFHYQFHPSWQTFLREIRESEGTVKHAFSQQYIPKGVMPIDDIRFSYKCAGGSLMDLGTYALSTVRLVLGANNKVLPTDVQYRKMSLINGNQAEPKIDQAISASLVTESGQGGLIVVDLASQGGWPSFLPASWTANIATTGWPKCEAVLEEVQVHKEQ